ncbi:retrovirus-related pol polyprotein from transposon TNT 1-94 [Tanacetum coccineum]|uniref:Retrovirus-related pol polyprotein from transposon TNT 1-94 n=1 Tax=Tanacetum coccineum TaxID=301880 RepID=A0ABQ4WDA6_9ASTR
MSKQFTKPKRKRDDSWFKDKVLLVQAQASGQILHEEELEFLADPRILEGQATQTPDLSDIPINVEVPKELPKVSLVHASLKKLKYQLANFDVDLFSTFNQQLVDELAEVQNVFYQMEQAVEQHRVESKTFEVKMNQALNKNERLLEQVMSKDIVNLIVNSSMDFPSVNVPECEKCLKLETELQKDFFEKYIYDKLFKRFTTLEKHFISLEVDTQLNQEIFQRNNSISNQITLSFDQLFELNELKAQSQVKDMVIKKLKEIIKSHSGNMDKDKIKQDLEEIETINIELDHRVTKLIAENEHLKQTYKQLYDSIKPTREKVLVITTLKDELRKLKGKDLANNEVTHHPSDPEINTEPITPKLLNKRSAHSAYINHTHEEAAVLRDLVDHIQANYPLDPTLESAYHVVAPKGTAHVQHSKINANSELKCVKCNGKVFSNIGYIWRPTGRTFTIVGNVCPLTRVTTTTEVPLRKPTALENETPKPVVTLVYSRKPRKSKTNVPISKFKVVQIILWYLDSGCSKHMTGDRSQLTNFVNKFLGTVKFGNDHVAKILGYGDYQIGNVTISRVYYVEGLGHNLFSVGQFCDSNLEVAFRQHTCFIRNLEGVDLLTGSRGNNLYTLSLGDMMASSPICLLSKASKTKSWLWHRRLSHLNFGAINHLARHGLVRGLPKLKFEKDHLCSACAMGKSKKKPHKPKSEDTNQEKLYLLHMDLCGPMRVASVNGKKYILVIVDDYSRFTWVKFLRSKDEAPDFIIKFLKMIQLRLKVPVRRIRTDNGTEFVNQTLREYYEKVGISHETSVARSPQQNGVVERRNRTLIEAARTMLIYAKAPLFLWAEAVATACYTQNRSIIRLRHGKTPYELLHDKLPDLSFFHVFGALCYPTNDSENLGKLQPKADIDFDELTTMASEHSSSGPTLHELTSVTISSGLVLNPPPSTPFVPPLRTDWDMLFQPLFDELLNPPPSVDHPAPEVVAPIDEVTAPEPAVSTGSPSSTIVDQDAPSPSNSQTTPDTQPSVIPNDVEEDNHDIEVAHMGNDPYFGILIPEVPSDQSSSSDSIHTNVPPDHQISEHNNKWTKDHPLENIIDALTQACWIEAMQEELNEFERLEVWELVPRLDKVMVITLKWIYKVKLDELGGILKNKARLVARGYHQEEGIDFEESFAPVARLEFFSRSVDPTLFIRRDGKELLLSKYALESLKKYGFDSCDPVDTPMVEKSKLDEDKEGKAVDPSHYRGMIGTLLYLTARTVNRGLWYPKDSSIALTAFADADHAGCQDTRCSTSGNHSLPTMALIKAYRHQIFFIKEHVENEVIELYFVNTEYQLADIFTKALGPERIEFLINKLGMRSFTLETLKQLADEVDE